MPKGSLIGGGLAGQDYVGLMSFSMARFNGRSPSQYSCHGLLFASNAGAVRIVKRCGRARPLPGSS